MASAIQGVGTMGQAAACCTARDDGESDSLTALPTIPRPHGVGRAFDSSEEELDVVFFDCAETEEDLSTTCDAIAQNIAERAREEWQARIRSGRDACEFIRGLLVDGCPELEWATISAGRRMLKANFGDEQKALEMLIQAIEIRIRNRQLFTSMSCKVFSDIRIIGKDVSDQPTVYLSAQTQSDGQVPLRDLRDQIVLAFEAGCRLTTEEGKVIFLADMHGLSPLLNSDLSVLKDLAETMGTIYAERIGQIIVVDFARSAQFVWYLLRPLLTEKTRKKLCFVSASEAKRMCKSQFSRDMYERICSSMAVNRDPACTPEHRALHARKTAACNVPLEPPVNGNLRVVL